MLLTDFAHTVFTVSIGTPYLLTILVLKFEIVRSFTSLSVCMSKLLLYVWHGRVYPDQTLHYSSDLGLHCYRSRSVSVLRVITVLSVLIFAPEK